MSTRTLIPTKPVSAKARPLTHAPGALLQRKCACGGASSHESECEDCKKKKFQCRATDIASGPASASPIGQAGGLRPAALGQHAQSFSESGFGHDFSKVRVQSAAEGESLRSFSPPRGAVSASGSGSIQERITRLKNHHFLCPPVADTLTNISKATGGGGTLGFTKIDQSSNLICAPKFDIDAKAGTCSFKAVAPSLSLTSKFSSPTPESLTSDSMPVPGCGEKPVPIYGKITQDISDLAKQGEQEHCDDLTISFNQTLKPCAAAVNKFAGHVFQGKTDDDCFKALTTSLGFDPISCSTEFADLTKKDDERDNTGMHDFDPVLVSKDCTKIVTGYKKSSTNKIGDASVAPGKFIPASSKCGKAVPPTSNPSAPPIGSGTQAPPPKKDPSGK